MRNTWKEAKTLGSKVELLMKEVVLPQIFQTQIHCNNDKNNTLPDLRIGSVEVEIKTAFTPYPKAITPSGLPCEEHITIDYANVLNYNDNLPIFILMAYDKPRLLFITAGEIKAIIKANPKRIYTRSPRSPKDKNKKIGIAASECKDVTIHINEEVMLIINELCNTKK